MVKILYVSADDSSKANSENNAYYIRHALERAGDEVIPYSVQPLTLHQKTLLGPYKVGYKILGKDFRASVEPSVTRSRTAALRQRIDEVLPDVVLANSPGVVAGLSSATPYVIYTDAPVSGLIEMGHYYDKWPQRSRDNFLKVDREVLQSATAIIYHTHWAAQAAIEDYGLDQRKVAVVPPGANLPYVDRSETCVSKPKGPRCELLFWGRDWQRKGGPIAVEATRILNESGIEATLTVCGPKVIPPEIMGLDYVSFVGFLPKNTETQLQRIRQIFRSADYMLLPTRADTSTSAIREASAFGVPSVVSNVGGLTELVADQYAGYALDPTASPETYARVIQSNFSDDTERLAMRNHAREMYESNLNWDLAISRIRNIISRYA